MSIGVACAKHPDGVWPEDSERSVTISEAPCSALTPSLRTAAPRVTIGALLYLLSLGLVGAGTGGVFFGVGLVNADIAAPDRFPPPAEIEPQSVVETPAHPSLEFAQNPTAQAALVPETSGAAAERSVRQLSARNTLMNAARNAPTALKAPALGVNGAQSKPRPSPLTGPVPRSMAHDARFTPPTQTGPATLTPPGRTGAAGTHSGHAG